MTDCPIGLICEYFECDSYGSIYCKDLADPWPLPCWVDPCWMPGVALLVTIPEFSQDCQNEEHLIAIQDRHDAWVERIREDYWLGGWWKAIDLPYLPHPEGGLLVIDSLRLDRDTTFSCPWRDIRQKVSDTYFECWEYFSPPVPLNRYRNPWDKRIEDNGFYPAFVLVYASDFAGSESEEYGYGD